MNCAKKRNEVAFGATTKFEYMPYTIFVRDRARELSAEELNSISLKNIALREHFDKFTPQIQQMAPDDVKFDFLLHSKYPDDSIGTLFATKKIDEKVHHGVVTLKGDFLQMDPLKKTKEAYANLGQNIKHALIRVPLIKYMKENALDKADINASLSAALRKQFGSKGFPVFDSVLAQDIIKHVTQGFLLS